MPARTIERACIDCGETFRRGGRATRCVECARKHERTRKTAWDRAQAEKRRPPAAPEIPGLLPIYRHGWAVDFARVDFDDWYRLKHLKFHLVARGYVSTTIDGRNEYLHRIILGLQPGADRKYEQTDHINRDPLDNRRSNLRIVTAKENNANRGGFYERDAA